MISLVLGASLLAGIFSTAGFAASETPVCGRPEHTHTDACYESRLVCGQQETPQTAPAQQAETVAPAEESSAQGGVSMPAAQDAAVPHTHTAECYEQVLVCGMEEHTHTSACYASAASGSVPASSGELDSVSASDPSDETGAAAPRDADAPAEEAAGEATVRYVQMPDGSLLVLAADGRIECEVPAELAAGFISDGTVDAEGLQAAIDSMNSAAPIDGMNSAGPARAPAANSPVQYAEVAQENAWIKAARYFDFVCKDGEEANKDLNDEVQLELQKLNGHTPAAVPAGTLNDPSVLPEGVKANSATHTFYGASVKGVKVHHVGLLRIKGVDYVYYTTDHEITPNTLYAVLNINSDTPGSDEEVAVNEKIRVEYRHVTGHQLEYIVQVEGGGALPAGWTQDVIFGGDERPLALNSQGDEQPHAAVPVNIPRGYQAEVTADFFPATGGPSMRVPIRYDGETESGKQNSLFLGVERAYDDSNAMSRPDAGHGETDARSATVFVECTHEEHATAQDQGIVVVTVTLTPYDMPTFNAVPWLNSVKGNFSFHGLQDQSSWNAPWYDGILVGQGGGANQATQNAEAIIDNASTSYDEETYRNPAQVKPAADGSGPYTMCWSINGIASSTGLGGDIGYNSTYIDRLEINGEPVRVPLIPDIKVPQGAGDGTPTYEEEATTTLSTGTVVTVYVQGQIRLTSLGQPFQVRCYTLSVSNCYEDITITGGRFLNNSKKQITVITNGVTDVEAWEHADANGWDTSATWWTEDEKWTPDNPAADWASLEDLNNTIDRTNDNWNANWFTDPIRFRRALGYQKPHIRVYVADVDATPQTAAQDSFVLIQDDDYLTPDGQRLLGPYATTKYVYNTGEPEAPNSNAYTYGQNNQNLKLAVELLVRKSADTWDTSGVVPQALAQNPGQGRHARYDYIGKSGDGSGNWIFACGWANLVKDSTANFERSDGWFKKYFSNWAANSHYRTAHTYAYSYDKTDYSDPWSESPDGYYYIRTTEELDRFMRDSVINGQVIIEITADPILAGVKYDANVGSETAPTDGSLPQGVTVSNVPYAEDDHGTTGYDNGGDKNAAEGKLGGYNVVDNSTLQIPENTPVSGNPDYIFDHWQLVDASGDPVEGEQYKFKQGDTIDLQSILTPALSTAYTEQQETDGTTRAVFTLKAVWVESGDYTGEAIPVTVNYHMVDEGHTSAALFHSESIGAVLETQAWADVFEPDGTTLNAKVVQILTDHGYIKADEDPKSVYMVYPANKGEQFYSAYHIDSVAADSAVLDVYLVKVFPVSTITIEKSWTTRSGKQSVPPGAVPSTIQVQLQRRTDGTDWEDVGSPVPLGVTVTVNGAETTVTTEGHEWTQFKYKTNTDSTKTLYQYRVVETQAGSALVSGLTGQTNGDSGQTGQFALPNTTGETEDTFEYHVTYTHTSASEFQSTQEEANLTWVTRIENQYQEPEEDTGWLTITKKVANQTEENANDAFNFTLTLALPDETDSPGTKRTWSSTDNVAFSQGAAGESANGSFTSMGGDSYTFSLKADQTLTLSDLPSGTVCTIEETLPTGKSYAVDYSGVTTQADGRHTVTIFKDNGSPVTVTNTEMGQFSVNKVVPGPDGETTGAWIDDTKFQIQVDFTFPEGVALGQTVTLDGTVTGAAEGELSGSYTTGPLTSQGGRTYRLELYLNNDTGTYTFDVPVGTVWVASEYQVAGYEVVSATGEGGTSDGGTSDADSEGHTTGTIGTTPDSVTFTNRRQTGSLEITKTVETGGNVPQDKAFQFALWFYQGSDTAGVTPVETQIYFTGDDSGKVNFADGAYTFSLQQGKTIALGGIPAGLRYKVAETVDPDAADYIVWHEATGYSKHEGPSTEVLAFNPDTADAKQQTVIGNSVTFTNQVKTVTVSGTKIWANLPRDAEGVLLAGFQQPQTVWVRLGTVNAQGVWQPYTKDGAMLDTVVSGDWTYSFTGLPLFDESGQYIQYAVRELDGQGGSPIDDGGTYTYTVTGSDDGNAACQDGYTVEYGAPVKTYPENGSTVVYTADVTNTRQLSLTVEKTVTGAMGDRNKLFPFTITLPVGTYTVGGGSEAYSDADGQNEITGTFAVQAAAQTAQDGGGQDEPQTGTQTFYLKHGGSLTLTNLASGTAYTVTEASVATEGYTVTATPATGGTASGETVTGSLTNTAANAAEPDPVVAFTNSREAPTPTGVLLDNWPYLLMLVLALGGGAALACSRWRRWREQMDNG